MDAAKRFWGGWSSGPGEERIKYSRQADRRRRHRSASVGRRRISRIKRSASCRDLRTDDEQKTRQVCTTVVANAIENNSRDLFARQASRNSVLSKFVGHCRSRRIGVTKRHDPTFRKNGG